MNKVKYPRTYHVPWSQGSTSDDKTLNDMCHFTGKEVVVTEKLDGECSSLYTRGLHARSIQSSDHPSRHWLKMFHSSFAHQIPENWRICGENVYAKHSIAYNSLTSYFYAFSVWNEENRCLSWDETVEWADLLGVETVPVLYRGVYDEKRIQALFTGTSAFGGNQEGYVIRLADSFIYDDFGKSIAKFVRANHVQTTNHWMHGEVTPNTLRS